MDRAPCGPPLCFHPRRRRDRRLGGDGAAVRLLRHLAAGDQHRDDDRHLPDGVPDPECPEPRRFGDPVQARRAHSRGRSCPQPVHRDRASEPKRAAPAAPQARGGRRGRNRPPAGDRTNDFEALRPKSISRVWGRAAAIGLPERAREGEGVVLRWIAALALATAMAPALGASTSPSLSTGAWWERVTVTLTGDGKAQTCRYETSTAPTGPKQCKVVGTDATGAQQPV